MTYINKVPLRDSNGKVVRTSNDEIFRVRKDLGGFTLNLFKNTAENERVDKTDYLESVGSIDGTLKDECQITTPQIMIYYDGVPDFNYVQIPAFSRYYYVTEITSVRTGLWRISLNVDVLMTYKNKIKELTAVIGRQENDFNEYLNDTQVIAELKQDVEIITIENDAFLLDADYERRRYSFITLG